MTRNLYFSIPFYFEEDTIQLPCHGDYAYWLSLLNRFITRADRVEIHCWDGEEASLDDLFAHCANEPYEVIREPHMTRVQITLSPAFTNYLRTSSINEANHLKWFSLSLSREGSLLFSSEHWGTEFFIPHVREDDAEMIQREMPPDSIFHFHEPVSTEGD
ncbi:hypothetical protein NCCP2716_26030 [Sporosarcina sp. NCCP-2716]|uniref:hypothetical protein n=1 Tax=Sporosarcina sp. NCCP-2716 TaxID=2943679 RepID=UPI00203F646E|nr:hypothetical protein [Sporosarcina sp. NCCP-2716]GKV70105.1 hypothetical protein NCCP2716_26030 [Sporosarcina sp. NCCP-2716]